MFATTASSALAQPSDARFQSNGEVNGLATSLSATVAGRIYRVYDAHEGSCLSIVDQRDYDGDGFTDALVALHPGCDGSCCQEQFLFVSYVGEGHFRPTAVFDASWGDPLLDVRGGRPGVVVTWDNEAYANYDDPDEVRTRYVLRDGEVVAGDSSRRMYLDAERELRVHNVASLPQDTWPTIIYDIDQDGRDDRVQPTELFDRWGRMYWTVTLSSGATYTGPACKRVGVLASTTRGVHDLVCDQDTVFTWGEIGYELQGH